MSVTFTRTDAVVKFAVGSVNVTEMFVSFTLSKSSTPVTSILADVLPAAKNTVAGIVTLLGAADDTLNVTPPIGAGRLNVKLIVVLFPSLTVTAPGVAVNTPKPPKVCKSLIISANDEGVPLKLI